MRPHTRDQHHNLAVGRAFRNLVDHLVNEGHVGAQIDRSIGEHVNAVAEAAYNLGTQEVTPSLN